MSRIQYNGNIQAIRGLFCSARFAMGGVAVRQGLNFGGEWAAVLLGPDLELPGMITNNPATAAGPLWNQNAGLGRPNVNFNNDAQNNWVRGHLVNGEWNGVGDDWRNLVPLTVVANNNHATIEQFMRNFAHLSLAHDDADYRNYWYGILYLVQCAQFPWAANPANNELYSYTPAFIKVSWRAVAVQKPNLQAANVRGYLNGNNIVMNPVLNLPFNPPQLPNALPALAGQCLPALNNIAGGAVFAGGPPNFPVQQMNGFDGDVEIHQN